MEKTQIQIRSYRELDAAQIATLFYETVHKINVNDYTHEQIHAWAPHKFETSFWHNRLKDCYTFVAEVNNTIIGFINLEPSGHIDCLYVHWKWQRQGVASELFSAIETQTRNLKFENLYTEASITAKPFFERKGFKVKSPQTVHKKGMLLKIFVMEKILK